MAENTSLILRQHSGQTEAGNVRDVKVDRIGKITIYKRGLSFWLYYREDRKTQRHRVDGNLAVARATAGRITAALAENRASPLGFTRTAPGDFAKAYVDYVENVQGLAWRTVDRYRAALDRFVDFCTQAEIKALDGLDQTVVEDFVRWLRSQRRARNGMAQGKKEPYKVGGIKFILSTCRTAFNWATRRRMLPPYEENPFRRFPIERLHDPAQADEGQRVFTVAQEQAFLKACSPWQESIFLPLLSYGMRVGELSHLLVENVDFKEGTIEICSKPAMFWRVKTSRWRKLPLTERIAVLLKRLIGRRKSGFVFLNASWYAGKQKPAMTFATDRLFLDHLEKLVAEFTAQNPQASKRQQRKIAAEFCQQMGRLPERRALAEFQKLTRQIGCPNFTRVHDLRHVFITRAQELGANPLIVQQIAGHATLDMTKRYTHLGMDTKRAAMERLVPGS